MSNTGKKKRGKKKEEARGEACRTFRDGAPLIRVGRGRCLVFPVIKTLPGIGENEDQDRDIKYLAIISGIIERAFLLFLQFSFNTNISLAFSNFMQIFRKNVRASCI